MLALSKGGCLRNEKGVKLQAPKLVEVQSPLTYEQNKE